MKNKVKVLAIIAIGLIGLNVGNVNAAYGNASVNLNVNRNDTGITYSGIKRYTKITVYTCPPKLNDKGKETGTYDCSKKTKDGEYTIDEKVTACGRNGQNCKDSYKVSNGTDYDSIDAIKTAFSCSSSNKVCDLKEENAPYYDNEFFVNFDDGPQNVIGYCLDPGFAMSSNVRMQCKPVGQERYAKAMKYIMNHDGSNHTVKQLALRFVGYDTLQSKTPTNNHAKAVRNYWRGSGNVSLSGTPAQEAWNLANEALNYGAENSGNKANSRNRIMLTQGSVIQNKANEDYVVEYKFQTTEEVPLNVKFSCEGNCSITGQSQFNATSGSFSVKVNKGQNNCGYTINAYYETDDDNSEIYVCDSERTDAFQRIAVSIEKEWTIPGIDSNPSGNASQSWSYKITSGEYYDAFCGNQCGSNEGTKVNFPTYCDKTENQMSITGPTNIKSCVLKSSDEAGYTYQDTTTVSANNPYCSVYCKEDYNMTLPGAQYTTSGSYFKLNPTTVTGRRSCYITGAANDDIEGIELDKFKTDVITAQRTLVDAYNSYMEEKAYCDGNGIGNYNAYEITNCDSSTGSCSISAPISRSITSLNNINVCGDTLTTKKNRFEEAQRNLESITNSIGECYNWSNNFCFNPEVSFDYNEEYTKDINYTQVGDIETEIGDMLGDNTVPETYEIPNSSKLTKQNVNFINCDSNGNCSNDGNKQTISPNTKYIRQDIKKIAKFENIQEFATKAPHGKVTPDGLTSKECIENGTCKENYEYLGAVFPVALKTTEGVYKWTLKFTRIGQANLKTSSQCIQETSDDAELGRLNKVVEKIRPEGVETNIDYVCLYVLDCDDCPVECSCGDVNLPDGWSCTVDGLTCKIEGPDPKCPECDVYCVNCIFNGNDTFSYRTISVNEINPNGRNMGANWDVNNNSKAKATVSNDLNGIEDQKEEVYKTPEYSFTITPTQMKNIRDYNNEMGTYIAADLDYKSYTYNGSTYENAVGYSTFLNMGQNKERNFFDTDPNKYKRNNEWYFWENVTDNIGPSWK